MYLKWRRLLSSLILIYVLSFNLIQTIYAANKTTLETIVDKLSSLTCETEGVGDLLHSEFSHTCVPAPFATLVVANIISPLLYADTMLRLKINDDSIFYSSDLEETLQDVKFPGGTCARKNRINANTKAQPNNEVLSFALCNNAKLLIANAKAVAKASIAILKGLVTGQNPWDDIKEALNKDRIDYHSVYYNQAAGDHGILYDLPFPIPWEITKENDRLCVSTYNIMGGLTPVGCKYIKEPFPKSMYSSFMDLEEADDTTLSNDQMLMTKCNNPGGCYQRAFNNSKTGIVITAPLIECIREAAVRLLVSKDSCSFRDKKLIIGSAKAESSSFFIFQRNMHKAVVAFLTIYVIIFGFKIILTGKVPEKGEFTTFVLKIVFVTYFSIGLNINPNDNSDYGRLDGMIEWVFPFLLGGISQLASWIMDASPSELCKFNASDYSPELAHLALWDALDCRVSHYLGLDVVATVLVENQARSHDFVNFDFFSFSPPPYFYLLVPALYSGNMTLVNLALMYPLLVISVAAYLVNSTVICMISIVILGILAPLFVPMMLFQYTKGYFESWVKLMISFLLQPMVVVVFMITMFSVYDVGFYGTCKYKSIEVNSAITGLAAAGAPNIFGSDNNRKVKIFHIDNEWEKSYQKDDAKKCKNSLGYMLNNPIQAAYDYSKSAVKDMVHPKTKTEEYIAQFAFLASVTYAPAMFFISPKVAFEKIRDIVLALITACFSLYLMYHFSAQLSEFAADMTQGVSLSSVTINPQTLYKTGMKVLSAAQQMKGAGDKLSAGGGDAEDKGAADGDSDGEDKVVADGGEDAEDSFSASGGSPAGTRKRSGAISHSSEDIITETEIDAIAATRGGNRRGRVDGADIITETEIDAIAATRGENKRGRVDGADIITETEIDAVAATIGGNRRGRVDKAMEGRGRSGAVGTDDRDLTPAEQDKAMRGRGRSGAIETDDRALTPAQQNQAKLDDADKINTRDIADNSAISKLMDKPDIPGLPSGTPAQKSAVSAGPKATSVERTDTVRQAESVQKHGVSKDDPVKKDDSDA